MKITYITAAEIPSRWAHSLQVVKMAQALQDIGHEVELLTACSVGGWVGGKDKRLVREQYDVRTDLKMTWWPLSCIASRGMSI